MSPSVDRDTFAVGISVWLFGLHSAARYFNILTLNVNPKPIMNNAKTNIE